MTGHAITKAGAVEALRRGAFDDSEQGPVVHCFLGFVGADWPLDAALDLVAEGEECWRVDHALGHNLAVWARGRMYHFDAQFKTEAGE